MDDYYCPKCGWGPVAMGERPDGDKVFKWRHCNDCGWQGQSTRYEVIRYDWGSGYKVDATIVLPNVALANTMRGHLQVPADAADILPGSFSSQELSASCPDCGAAIQLCEQIFQDLSGFKAVWSCKACGYQSEAIKVPAPALFTHSESYRWISWKGKNYELTRNQAAIVGELHRAYLDGAPDVHRDKLLKKAAAGRVRDSFRCANRELWNTLIIHAPRARRGTLRLNL